MPRPSRLRTGSDAIAPVRDLIMARVGRGDLTLKALAARIGLQPSWLSGILGGVRPVPVDRIERLADALDLAGAERERFIDDAWLTHAPDRVRERFNSLRATAKPRRSRRRAAD